jgi:gingipain R
MSGTCFAEAWMRATHSGQPIGAAACYMSTVNQQWATPMRAQDVMIDLLCAGEKWTFGGTCFNGSCAMIDRYGSYGVTEFKNWTIFGDPSLEMRTATPTVLVVTRGDHVDPATGVFELTTEPGATAALSDQAVLLGSAIADGTGLAVITFDPAVMGALTSVTLTVTGFNRIPDVESLAVQAGATSAPAVDGGIHVAQNEPNPFARTTTISLALDRESRVRVDIYDVAGRKIRALEDGVLAAGAHRLTWDGRTDGGTQAASGTYFYRLVTPDRTETRRMVRLR